jgi:membrane-bound ClpP family serine protease
MSPKKKIANWDTIGAAVDLGLVALLWATFRVRWLFGTLGALALLCLAFGFTPGMLIRELDEKPEDSPPRKPKDSPYASLVGGEAEVIAELKPQGLIRVGNERISAKSVLGFIPVGTLVTIVEAELTAVVVEKMEKT